MARRRTSRCAAHQRCAHESSQTAVASSTGAASSSSKVPERSARNQATCEAPTGSAPATSLAQLSQSTPPASGEKRETAASPHAQQASSSGRQPAWASTLNANAAQVRSRCARSAACSHAVRAREVMA